MTSGLSWRFIPACAGNRLSNSHAIGQLMVHPRVCGEQLLTIAAKFGAGGSSPRVRGTGLRAMIAALLKRFIPACAGNRDVATSVKMIPTVHPRVCGEQEESERE